MVFGVHRRARIVCVLTGRKSAAMLKRATRRAPRRAAGGGLSGDRGEELGGWTSSGGQEVVAVEHFVCGDRVDLDGRRAEVEDRDAVLPTRTAAHPDDETRRLRDDGRDVPTVVVVPAPAAGHLLEVTDQLIDPAHTFREYALPVPFRGRRWRRERMTVTRVSRRKAGFPRVR